MSFLSYLNIPLVFALFYFPCLYEQQVNISNFQVKIADRLSR